MTRKRLDSVLFAVAAVSLAIYALACYSQGGVEWSPDDEWFAFTCTAPAAKSLKEDRCAQLWTYHVRKQELRLLDQDMAPMSRPAVFPDGGSVLYLRQDEGQEERLRVFRYDCLRNVRHEIGTVSIGGGDAKEAALLWGPQLSPDGKSFSVIAMNPKDEKEAMTLVVDVERLEVKKSIPNLAYAHWTPDGAALVGLAGAKEGEVNLVRVDIDSGKRTVLLETDHSDQLAWAQLPSPGGSYVADIVKPADDQAGPRAVIVSLKDAAKVATMGKESIPVGWARDESALYVLIGGTPDKVPQVVRWNFKTAEEAVVYELPALYAMEGEGSVWGTLSHDNTRIVLRTATERGEDEVIVLADLGRKTTVPILPHDASRLRLAGLHKKLIENLLEADRAGEARAAMDEMIRYLKTSRPLMVHAEARRMLAGLEFEVYFEALDDPVGALEALGAADGGGELRVRCLVRMGRMDDALKAARELPAPEGEEPEIARDIQTFRKLDATVKLEEADAETLSSYIDLAGRIGATDRKIRACRALVGRNVEQKEKQTEARDFLARQEKLERLRGRGQ